MTGPGARGGSVAGLVLAAGRGERFGDATKQLALLDGRPLVLHVLDTARTAGLDPLVVVVGHDGTRVRRAVTGSPHGTDVLVVDVGTDRPQSASLRAGLAALATYPDVVAVAVLLADEPGLDPDDVEVVVDAWRDGTDDVVRASYTDRPGHPFVASRAVWPALMEVAGDRGARAAPVTPVLVPVRAPAPVDVDTPTDLRPLTDTDRIARRTSADRRP